MKIEKLTKEQEELLKVYRDKWMAIGLSTEPANRAEAERGIELMYAIKGLKKPKIVWCMSPLTSGLTRHCVMSIKKTNIGTSVGDSVWNSVLNSVWYSVMDSVRDSVGDSVWNSVLNSVWYSVVNSVLNSVWDSVLNSVGNSVRNSVGNSVYGQHDANWLGFYDYFNNVLKLEKQTEALNGLWILSKNAGWAIPHENICWVSERHNICKLNNRGVIHCDGGPAIAYPDGFKVWGLNGIRVPQYLAETPEGQLDIEFFKKETNADVRAEFIRKFGVQRMTSLGKKIADSNNHSNEWFKASEYELWNMGNIYGRERAIFLKMKNLTTGIYHFEGVSPECNSVEEALKYRAKNRIINLEGVK